MFVLRNKAETFCVLPFSSPRLSGMITLMLTRSSRATGEARLRYLDADFDVLAPGDYVVCAVTGRKIPLQALRYWSVDRQEAYWDADAASSRMVPAKA
jgi:hypothetical protein